MTKRVKVVHVVPSLDTGGMENGIVNLCNGHDRDIFDVSICCLKSKGSMASRLRSDVEIISLNMPEGKGMSGCLKVLSFFRKKAPQVVHTHGFAGGSLYGILGARLAGVPVVVNGEHGAFYLKAHQVFIQRILERFCTLNLSVSESLKEKVVANLKISPERIRVILNGVDTRLFSGSHDVTPLKEELEKTHNLRINDNDFIIGCVGSLKPAKNQKMLIDAVKTIRTMKHGKNEKRCIVLFIGNGPDLGFLKQHSVEAGLSDSVAFLGERQDMPRWLSLMDVLTSTSISLHEGLSNVILEAMSSGLPVISTKSVGSQEIISQGENGFLVEQNDARQLGERLALLMDDSSLLKEMGSNARDFICREFSLERMISNYEKTYAELIGARGC